jgi:hypothetical protein
VAINLGPTATNVRASIMAGGRCAGKTVNRELEAKARDLAGLQGYVTNLTL